MELDNIIRPNRLKDVTGLSRATIYRKIKKKEFPKPIVLSHGAVGWPESVIAEWRADPAGWKPKPH